MKISKIAALVLAVALLLPLCGCNQKDNNSSQSDSGTEPVDEFVIYHSSKELNNLLTSAINSYSKATGKNAGVKFVEGSLLTALEAEKPSVYIVDTDEDISAFYEKGLFTGVQESLFGESAVSNGIWLSTNGENRYGIPLMLEGYGYIFDREMLADLFGAEDISDLAEDLKSCSYNDFNGFVDAVETYIEAPSAASVTVNGNEYTFAEAKTGRAQMLSGVFALTAESSRAYEYLTNYALAAKFGTKSALYSAAENDVLGTKGVFSAVAKALDDITGHISGTGGTIGKGDEFIGGDYTYSAAVDAFTGSFALFYAGSSADADDFKKSSVTFGDNLDIIPMKLPLSDEDITAAGMSAEKLNSSIVIGSRYYIAFNPNGDESAIAAAYDFVKWLFNEPEGMTAYSENFGGIPLNYSFNTNNEHADNSVASDVSTESGNLSTAKSTVSESGAQNSESSDTLSENGSEITSIGNFELSSSLMRSVAKYYAEGNWIPELATSVPGSWNNDIFGKSLSDYWGKTTWSDDDRENLVTGWIDGWTGSIKE